MFHNDLKNLDYKGLLRKISDRGIASCGQPIPSLARIEISGEQYINFASNDYLGLAASPTILEAAKKSLEVFPFGAGASRLLSGGTTFHSELEEVVTRFKKTGAALVFNSGYQANVSCISALAREGDVIFSDELNHASIVDGCRLSRAKKVVYPHGDVDTLSISRRSAGFTHFARAYLTPCFTWMMLTALECLGAVMEHWPISISSLSRGSYRWAPSRKHSALSALLSQAAAR
jgi:7-keto-8-aminopelargonate synthetase-like enzyme